jgi:hypothetical protein
MQTKLFVREARAFSRRHELRLTGRVCCEGTEDSSAGSLRARFWTVTLCLLSAAFLLLPADALAQEQSRYGGRVGFSASPDQLTLGAFLGFTEINPSVRPRPSIDFGFGDEVFTAILNGDLEYGIRDTGIDAMPFVGAGVALAFYKFDFGPASGDADETNWEVGIQVYGGLEKDLGGYKTGLIEVRVGFLDVPDVKITVGMGFF